MPVPQILEKIVLMVSLTSATVDRRANVDVPIPQVAGGVFTPDGLFESGWDCVTPKTRKSTAERKYGSSLASLTSTAGNTRQSLQLQI